MLFWVSDSQTEVPWLADNEVRLMLLYHEPHSLRPKFSFPGSVMKQYCHNNLSAGGIATENETKAKRSYLIHRHGHNCIVVGNTEVLISLLLFLYIHKTAYVKYPLQCRNQEAFNKCFIKTDQEDGRLQTRKRALIKINQLESWSWTSSLQNWNRHDLCLCHWEDT